MSDIGGLADKVCAHKNWQCVGDHGVVCADCGHSIVDGRRPEAILAEKVDNLSAEVASIRKDAQRYRFWRENSTSINVSIYVAGIPNAEGNDSIVDAAMTTSRPPPSAERCKS